MNETSFRSIEGGRRLASGEPVATVSIYTILICWCWSAGWAGEGQVVINRNEGKVEQEGARERANGTKITNSNWQIRFGENTCREKIGTTVWHDRVMKTAVISACGGGVLLLYCTVLVVPIFLRVPSHSSHQQGLMTGGG